jgi:hypothetical protein
LKNIPKIAAKAKEVEKNFRAIVIAVAAIFVTLNLIAEM